mgnify:CR=1 FL=1
MCGSAGVMYCGSDTTFSTGEASMMARYSIKTRLHNLEPEDLRGVMLTTRSTMRVPVPGHNATG